MQHGNIPSLIKMMSHFQARYLSLATLPTISNAVGRLGHVVSQYQPARRQCPCFKKLGQTCSLTRSVMQARSYLSWNDCNGRAGGLAIHFFWFSRTHPETLNGRLLCLTNDLSPGKSFATPSKSEHGTTQYGRGRKRETDFTKNSIN